MIMVMTRKRSRRSGQRTVTLLLLIQMNTLESIVSRPLDDCTRDIQMLPGNGQMSILIYICAGSVTLLPTKYHSICILE